MPASVTVTIPNVPPTVSLTAPADGATFTAPATITVTANAADSDGSITQVQFYDSGTTLLTTDTTAPYTFDLVNVGAGTYNLSAKATDNNGAQTTSSTIQFTVTSGTPQAYYIHTDQLNTPRLITDASNNKVWQWDNNDPFGNNVPNDDPNGTNTHFRHNLRFPGQYADSETGLNYNYFRDYSPQEGRYIQSDPIGLEGGQFSAYAYVDSNPLLFTDEEGLASDGRGPYGPVTNTVLKFTDNYSNMRDANTIGADKYFHCMANCQSARSEGVVGQGVSKLISETRELTDENIKGTSREACDADRQANDTGRNGGKDFKNTTCSNICGGYRPKGLNPRY